MVVGHARNVSDSFFVAQHRQSLREAHPEMGFGQISKLAASQWKALLPNDKQRYVVMAINDKQRFVPHQFSVTNVSPMLSFIIRYNEEMKRYTPPPGTKGYDEFGRKRKRSLDSPKLPLSAYFMFTRLVRSKVVLECQDLKLPEVTKEIARRWRLLTDEEKKPYEQMSQRDKDR